MFYVFHFLKLEKSVGSLGIKRAVDVSIYASSYLLTENLGRARGNLQVFIRAWGNLSMRDGNRGKFCRRLVILFSCLSSFISRIQISHNKSISDRVQPLRLSSL